MIYIKKVNEQTLCRSCFSDNDVKAVCVGSENSCTVTNLCSECRKNLIGKLKETLE